MTTHIHVYMPALRAGKTADRKAKDAPWDDLERKAGIAQRAKETAKSPKQATAFGNAAACYSKAAKMMVTVATQRRAGNNVPEQATAATAMMQKADSYMSEARAMRDSKAKDDREGDIKSVMSEIAALKAKIESAKACSGSNSQAARYLEADLRKLTAKLNTLKSQAEDAGFKLPANYAAIKAAAAKKKAAEEAAKAAQNKPKDDESTKWHNSGKLAASEGTSLASMLRYMRSQGFNSTQMQWATEGHNAERAANPGLKKSLTGKDAGLPQPSARLEANIHTEMYKGFKIEMNEGGVVTITNKAGKQVWRELATVKRAKMIIDNSV